MTIIRIPEDDWKLLEWIGFGPGTYPAGGGPDFVIPSDRPDFYIRFFENNGKFFAELPDSVSPAYNGTMLDIIYGGDVSVEWEGKAYIIFV